MKNITICKYCGSTDITILAEVPVNKKFQELQETDLEIWHGEIFCRYCRDETDPTTDCIKIKCNGNEMDCNQGRYLRKQKISLKILKMANCKIVESKLTEHISRKLLISFVVNDSLFKLYGIGWGGKIHSWFIECNDENHSSKDLNGILQYLKEF